MPSTADLREIVAHHEAGHAIAAIVRGHPIREVWIADTPQLDAGTLGEVRYVGDSIRDAEYNVDDYLVFLIAGELAQRRAFPTVNLHSRFDRERIAAICDQHWPGNPRAWKSHLDDAKKLIGEHRRGVEAIAHTLLRCGRLTGSDFVMDSYFAGGPLVIAMVPDGRKQK